MNRSSPRTSQIVTGPIVVQMIPSSHHTRDHDPIHLATAMRSLVIDQRHPIALEITGSHQQRRLLIRARSSEDLAHVQTQLHARLPHATFVPLTDHDDPFQLQSAETVSAVELRAGQASYLPLQEFERRKTGEDPILGILGALDALPPDLRAIAQIALVPASPTWSQPYQRKAIEHALDPERQQERRKQAAGHDPGTPSVAFLLVAISVLIGSLFLLRFPTMLPAWMPTTIQALLHGEWQQIVSGPHHWEFDGIIGAPIVFVGMILVLKRVWLSLFRPPLYDQRTVAEQLARPAYQVCLRLYVIGPCSSKPSRRITGQRVFLRFCLIAQRRGAVVSRNVLQLRPRQWKQGLARWFIELRVMVKIIWAVFSPIIGLLQARQWRKAVTAFSQLLMQTGRKMGSLSQKRGITFKKHAMKALASFFHWGGKRLRSLSTGLFDAVSHALLRQRRYRQATRQERTRRRHILARLIAAYRQYHLGSGNYFVSRRVSTHQAHSFIERGMWWKAVLRSRHLIAVETLADLWHAPDDEALPDLAHMAYRRSRSRLLPPGLQDAQQELPIGHSEHAGHHISVGLPADTLRSHMLIGGKSGEGKSTFMQHLALRSMMEPGGLVVIDPHGDLVEQILRLVPEERRDDVMLIDLSDERFACGINLLDVTMARGRDKVISDLIKIFSHIWASAWGSRMEIAFEYALRTLYEANKVLVQRGHERHQYTLLDVMAVLTDESFCHSLLEQIKDPFIRRWWATYFDPLSLQMQRDRVDPVLSKVAKFEGTIARHILGQSLSTVDLFECIAQEKILLVKLAKGVVGEDVARILGAMLLGLVQVSLEEQGRMNEAQRKHLPILIDEFQVLEGVDWGALAELRKYGATFCLATQSLDYLREKQILPVVLANVKQFAIFRMSAEDAKLLARELDVEPEDIVHLESLTCYLKLVSRHQQQATFSLTLHFLPPGEEEPVQRIRTRCQRNSMRPVSEIEIEIVEHLARVIGAVPSRSKPAQEQKESQPRRARQDGGSRGRKGQDIKRKRREGDAPAQAGGEITQMNWQETVGKSEEVHDADEHREDDHIR